MSFSFRLHSFLSWLPGVIHHDEQLWHMRQTTAFDPKPTSTTDRYQKGMALSQSA